MMININRKENEEFHLKIFRKDHTDQLKSLMIEIVSVILAEYESVPFPLLESLFVRIIDPEKVIEE